MLASLVSVAQKAKRSVAVWQEATDAAAGALGDAVTTYVTGPLKELPKYLTVRPKARVLFLVMCRRHYAPLARDESARCLCSFLSSPPSCSLLLVLASPLFYMRLPPVGCIVCYALHGGNTVGTSWAACGSTS